ncbi:MAG: CPXCG motif-containing cysteine-rich protein [Sandaracinaceae bacterium]|nr:CPXCG motif-containing cysteine-rich protein [Sandaracinaceae bacterium]
MSETDSDVALVSCPWCFETIELYVDPETRGAFIEDCEICCRPWRVYATREDGEVHVSVERA